MIKAGSTDVTVYLRLIDSTTGAAETGLTIADLDIVYIRNRAAAVKADATALAAADSAHADNKAIEVDATNAPGVYRVDFPDAAFAAGVDKVQLIVNGSGLALAQEEVELVAYDPQDAVRLGLTALPNAAADAAGGLPISDDGELDLDTLLGRLDAAISTRSTLAAGAAMTLTEAYDAAKTAAQAGDEMDLVDAPNSTALAAIKTALDELCVVLANAAHGGEAATLTLSEATGISTHTPEDVWQVASLSATLAGWIWNAATASYGTAGTYGAAIEDTLADTNELQANQGNWLTATGFSTHSAADVKTAIEAAGSHLAEILTDTGTTLPNALTAIYEVVTHATYGLSAINTNVGTVDSNVDTLIDRLTALRAGYLDTLNVSGTLAHSDAAATYKATGFSTHSAADVWQAGPRALTDPDSYKADVSALATTAALAVVDGIVDAIKLKTDLIPASPAAVGSAMTLADDAISAAKYDETTAFPLASADSGATAVARTGADGDTLETLSDEIAAIVSGSTVNIDHESTTIVRQ